jgi:YggT family protein
VATFAEIYPLVILFVQRAFLVAAVVLGIVCLLDWLVRTRRISPFNAISRFMRRTIDPLLAPMERRVLRAGGTPGSVPLWALLAVVVAGILLLSLLQFVGGQAIALARAVSGGPRTTFVFLVAAAFAVLQMAIMVRVLASWIPSLSPFSPWVRWAFVLSEPVLAPLRRLIPPIGGSIDITPILAYFLVRIIGGFVVGMVARATY